MLLSVYLTEQAHDDIAEISNWWATHRSSEQAHRWHDACEAAIDALPKRLARCPLAPENGDFPFEVRQSVFGIGRRRTHRVIFTVRPDMVLVLRIQHLAQDQLTLDDI